MSLQWNKILCMFKFKVQYIFQPALGKVWLKYEKNNTKHPNLTLVGKNIQNLNAHQNLLSFHNIIINGLRNICTSLKNTLSTKKVYYLSLVGT